MAETKTAETEAAETEPAETEAAETEAAARVAVTGAATEVPHSPGPLQSKILTQPHTGKEELHHSTATGGVPLNRPS